MGLEDFNSSFTKGNVLPWLQDTATESVWSSWGVEYRDVRILDSENQVVGVYNLTVHDLSLPENRETLKAMLLEAAQWIDADEDQLPDDWERTHFGNLSFGPTDDPDEDGQDNFSECAFGTRPNDSASRPSFQAGTLEDGNDRFLTMSFRRRLGSHLDYQLETSPDLIQWSAPPGEITILEPLSNLSDQTGTGRIRYLLNSPMNGTARGFMRVRALPSASGAGLAH